MIDNNMTEIDYKIEQAIQKDVPLTKDAAIILLKQYGILDENGKITDAYQDIFIKDDGKS